MPWVRRLAVLVPILALLAALGAAAAGWVAESMAGAPLPVLWKKAQQRWGHRYPSVFGTAGPAIDWYVSWFDRALPGLDRALPDPDDWRGRGADPGLPARGAARAPLRTVRVEDPRALLEALAGARTGDEIVLAPGTYELATHALKLGAPGTAEHPVRVRAERLGDARLRLDTVEGFLVSQPFWVFENLDVGGACERHDRCEHAFHVVGAALSTVIRNNRIHDFNAPIKVNGARAGERVAYPDGGLIEGNSLYNLSPRETAAPVTMIDIVAANDWVVRDNLIADFVKQRGDRTSYGAFVKGNATGGVLERNLVVCGMRLPLVGVAEDRRVGLSLGGGGTSDESCRGRRCEVESTGGIVRNNVILHCSDFGIYLNRARDASVVHNTLFNTWGIAGRFADTRAAVSNNLYSGWIRGHDGARLSAGANLRLAGGRGFRDPRNGDFALVRGHDRPKDRAAPSGTADDFCGAPRPRDEADVGAFEYDGDEPACRPFG